MGDTAKVREIKLYSEKVAEEDVLNFFNQIQKSRIPLFGFLDFSDIFSPNIINLIITKRLNTLRFFAEEKKALAELSLLVFPYKIDELMEIQRARASMLPFPRIYFLPSTQNFLDFTVKESISEMKLRVGKILGKFIAWGTASDERGKKSILIATSPEKFLRVDMEQNPAVYIEILDPIPKRMSVTSQFPVFEETGITVGVDNFDVFQHTLFVGASGTGKSKGLYAMIKAIEAKYGKNVRMVVLDPHGEFIRCLHGYKVVNLIDNYIEPLELGGIQTPLMTQLIAQLLSSAIGQENKYSERVLFYVVHLLSSTNKMTLRNISLLLTDSSKRAEFISECNNDEVKRFFDEEFNDIYIHHFNDAVLPILNFVGEYELYLGGEKKREELLDLIKQNNITVISFNPNFFGKRMINFLAGAIINQMYILAITERLTQPTLLIVDEFQRVETRVVRDILAETRKFNLYLYMSMQYLGQMNKEIRDSVVSNVRNIVAFKSNREDAATLSSIMEIKIEESFKKARTQTELEESKKEMFVRLHQRECIVRLFDGKKYILPMKLRVVDVSRWNYSEVSPPEFSRPPPQQKRAEDKPKEKEEPQATQQEEIAQPEAPAEKQVRQEGADWSAFKKEEPSLPSHYRAPEEPRQEALEEEEDEETLKQKEQETLAKIEALLTKKFEKEAKETGLAEEKIEEEEEAEVEGKEEAGVKEEEEAAEEEQAGFAEEEPIQIESEEEPFFEEEPVPFFEEEEQPVKAEQEQKPAAKQKAKAKVKKKSVVEKEAKGGLVEENEPQVEEKKGKAKQKAKKELPKEEIAEEPTAEPSVEEKAVEEKQKRSTAKKKRQPKETIDDTLHQERQAPSSKKAAQLPKDKKTAPKKSQK